MYLQYSRPPYLSPFAKYLEGVVQHQHVYLFSLVSAFSKKNYKMCLRGCMCVFVRVCVYL